jgi:hypothetical protein
MDPETVAMMEDYGFEAWRLDERAERMTDGDPRDD